MGPVRYLAGTAVVVCPVGSLTYKGEKHAYCGGGENVGPVCQMLYDALTSLQTEQSDDPDSWVVPLDEMKATIEAAIEVDRHTTPAT